MMFLNVNLANSSSAGGGGECTTTPRTPEILNLLSGAPFDNAATLHSAHPPGLTQQLRSACAASTPGDGPSSPGEPASSFSSSFSSSPATPSTPTVGPPSIQNTRTYLIKEGLKLTIQSKRLASGRTSLQTQHLHVPFKDEVRFIWFSLNCHRVDTAIHSSFIHDFKLLQLLSFLNVHWKLVCQKLTSLSTNQFGLNWSHFVELVSQLQVQSGLNLDLNIDIIVGFFNSSLISLSPLIKLIRITWNHWITCIALNQFNYSNLPSNLFSECYELIIEFPASNQVIWKSSWCWY